MSPLIVAQKISKIFNPGQPNQVQAVKNCSLEINSGEVWVFAGPSGCGKTTLLSLLGLMMRPTAGRLSILGEETTLFTERERTLFRRRHIGFLFQDFHLLPDLTLQENLELVLFPEGRPLREIWQRIKELASRLGLRDKIKEKVSHLSGGEKQRVSLARALLNDPQLLIVDEPTAHLDSQRSQEILNLFKALKDQGLTLLIASHDPLVIKAPFVDHVAWMKDGQIETLI